MIIDDLSEPELVLWEAFPAARPVDLPGAVVRAEIIARLLLGGAERRAGQTPGLQLSGARITGRLDLSYAEVQHPLILKECDFEQAPILTAAHTGLIGLATSRLPGLQAADAVIGGGLRLEACVINGPLLLSGAQVSGTLGLSTGWNLHEFRHSALTHLGEAGASLLMLMAKSRHKKPENLLRYFKP